MIGQNVGWKQEVNLGKRNNQAFVFIPHARFIEMLTYKAALVGIQVVTIAESHTSKCSFLDREPLSIMLTIWANVSSVACLSQVPAKRSMLT